MVNNNQVILKNTKRAAECIAIWHYIKTGNKEYNQVIQYAIDNFELSDNKEQCVRNMLRRLQKLGCLKMIQERSSVGKSYSKTYFKLLLEPIVDYI